MCEIAELAVVELPVDAKSVPAARRFVARTLCAAHCRPVTADAVLLASELVTNAAVHGGPPIRLTVECTGDAIEIRVRDGSPQRPVRRVSTADETGGRGLVLVDALSTSWGVDADPSGGKETWFRLSAS
jgi:anti-sigma regulatory factor (Ser/Thr protein kinase)